MAHRRARRYIALENKNFDFTRREVENFDILFNMDYSLNEIARHLRRTRVETFLLYLDRVDQEKVKPKYVLVRRD